jgi:hypothetical protein
VVAFIHDRRIAASSNLRGGFVIRAPGIEAFSRSVGQDRTKDAGVACVEAVPHDGKWVKRGAIGAGLKVGLVAPHLTDRLPQIEVELATADVGFEVDDLVGEASDLVRLEVLPREKMLCDP